MWLSSRGTFRKRENSNNYDSEQESVDYWIKPLCVSILYVVEQKKHSKVITRENGAQSAWNNLNYCSTVFFFQHPINNLLPSERKTSLKFILLPLHFSDSHFERFTVGNFEHFMMISSCIVNLCTCFCVCKLQRLNDARTFMAKGTILMKRDLKFFFDLFSNLKPHLYQGGKILSQCWHKSPTSSYKSQLARFEHPIQNFMNLKI